MKNEVKGFFRVHDRLISGWAVNLRDSSQKQDIEIFVDGESVGFARADRYDAVVQAQYGGDGHYGFAFYFSDERIDPINAVAAAMDTSTRFELRTKQPLVTRSPVAAPPLTIETVRLSNHVELIGRIGSYPKRQLGLEFWSGTERVISGLQLTWINKDEGLFSVRLNPEAATVAMSGAIEVALPGLKEAGLATRLRKKLVSAFLRQSTEGLSIQLRGDFEQQGPVPLTVRLTRPNRPPIDLNAYAEAGLATAICPAEFPLLEGSVGILIGGAAIPTQFHPGRPLSLADGSFATIAKEEAASGWRASDNAVVERGFFAFPSSLADEHALSGHVAHLSRRAANGQLCLSQVIEGAAKVHDSFSTVAVLRACQGARLSLRLRDDLGVICETSATSRGDHSWVVVRLECEIARELDGDLNFEIEASAGTDELDVAMGNSVVPVATNQPSTTNLLANEGLEQWPYGAGKRQHSMRGEICQGWRLFNRRCQGTVWTRAVMDPIDNSLGLALAAPEIADYLRLEGDLLGSELKTGSFELKFRAGVPPAGRQMLARQADAVADFMLIDRIYVLRRIHTVTADGFTEKDDICAVIARKVPVAWEMERFSFSIPPLQLRSTASFTDDDAAGNKESYHLVFEFRRPTVLAIHDVQVCSGEVVEGPSEETRLRLEDRHIELQLPLLKGIQHWSAATAVRPRSNRPSNSRLALKWSADASREPVEIIIPVFNALDETLACLNSLCGSTTVPILVRLIDDGSDAPVRAALEDYCRDKPWIILQSFETNRGYTFAADFGIRAARAHWVVLLNSDTIVTHGWLEGMLACARSDPRIAFVGPLSNAATYQSVPNLYDAAGKWKVNALPRWLEPDDMADIVRRTSCKAYPEVPLLNGFCTLMRRSAFIEAGGLNHGAFPAGYGEENDLCLRVTKAGARLAVADDVYVFHVKSASFGNLRREELSKKGSTALRKLHPDVDLRAMTAAFRDVPALVAARAAVAEELARLQAHSCHSDECSKVLEEVLDAADQSMAA